MHPLTEQELTYLSLQHGHLIDILTLDRSYPLALSGIKIAETNSSLEEYELLFNDVDVKQTARFSSMNEIAIKTTLEFPTKTGRYEYSHIEDYHVDDLEQLYNQGVLRELIEHHLEETIEEIEVSLLIKDDL